jgi:hypothetical protein
MIKGSEGHTLHGGSVAETGEPAWNIAYSCRQGAIRNELLTVCVQLSDTNPGDGGFCILPGSHKSNFPVPRKFFNVLYFAYYIWILVIDKSEQL